jgi:hypothetical protein
MLEVVYRLARWAGKVFPDLAVTTHMDSPLNLVLYELSRLTYIVLVFTFPLILSQLKTQLVFVTLAIFLNDLASRIDRSTNQIQLVDCVSE